MNLSLDVKITGMNELEAAIESADEKYKEYLHAVNAIRTAACRLGVEINQPPAGTGG